MKPSLFALLLPALATLALSATPPALKVRVDTLGPVLAFKAANASTVVKPMQIAKDSLGMHAFSPKQSGTPKPLEPGRDDGGKLIFKFTAPKAGVYTLYALAYWIDGGSNSFFVRMDTSAYRKLGNDGDMEKWITVRGPTFTVDAGEHRLTIREREPGARLRSLFLVPVDAFIADRCRFADSLLVVDRPVLCIDPPYGADDAGLTLRIFLADTGKAGILAEKKPLPFTIKAGFGKVLCSGAFPNNCLFTAALPAGLAPELTIVIGKTETRFVNIAGRLSKLTNTLASVQKRPDPLVREVLRPTILLCRENAIRGFKLERQYDAGPASYAYADSQLIRAEALASKTSGTFSMASTEGIQEYACFSSKDSALCPYTLYLPREYAKRKTPSAAILFLHGADGTQWSLEKEYLSRGLNPFALTVPVIAPLYRGNAAWSDTIQEDLLQLTVLAGRYMRIDTARLVLSGFSRGGYTTWAMAYTCPTRFMTLIPIAGGHPSRFNDSFRKGQPLPPPVNAKIIILHSPEDEVVKFEEAREMEKLSARLNPWFIPYAGGHNLPGDLVDFYNRAARP